MKPSEALRRYWKVKRDTQTRGYSSEKVIEAIEKRMGDSLSHILNQETDSDIIFSIENKQGIHPNEMVDDDPDMLLKITCPNDIYFEQLLDILRLKTKLFITHSIDHLKQEITISGEVKAARISEAALCLGLDIEDLTGTNPIWADDYLGLMQILLLYQISTQLRRNGIFLKTDVL